MDLTQHLSGYKCYVIHLQYTHLEHYIYWLSEQSSELSFPCKVLFLCLKTFNMQNQDRNLFTSKYILSKRDAISGKIFVYIVIYPHRHSRQSTRI